MCEILVKKNTTGLLLWRVAIQTWICLKGMIVVCQAVKSELIKTVQLYFKFTKHHACNIFLAIFVCNCSNLYQIDYVSRTV